MKNSLVCCLYCSGPHKEDFCENAPAIEDERERLALEAEYAAEYEAPGSLQTFQCAAWCPGCSTCDKP